MRLAYVTDMHLDHVRQGVITDWLNSLKAQQPDVILIGGDIAVAQGLEAGLRKIRETVGVPLAFVLGNHDFYGSSFAAVENRMRLLAKRGEGYYFLDAIEVPLTLGPGVALVGCSGWGDFSFGLAAQAHRMSDEEHIGELRILAGKDSIGEECRKRGALYARHLEGVLADALRHHRKVIVLTHVPPFPEASFQPEGGLADDAWLPHAVSGQVGSVILELAHRYPDGRIEVYAGHTHGEGIVRITDNVRVIVSGATYGYPRAARIIEVPSP